MKPKLGVLFVHGIGEQRRGESLTQWGDALVLWLAGSDDVFASYRREYGPRFSSVTASGAEVAPDGDSDSPAHVELSLEINPGLWAHDAPREEWRDAPELRERWLLAEGFWADTVHTPGIASTLRWILMVLPWTLLSHFDRVAQRGTRESMLRAPGSLWLMLLAVMVLPLAPLLGIVLVLLLVLRLAPFDFARNLSAQFQRAIAATVGDSMTLLDSPIQRAAIIDRVHAAYKWLEERGCEEIAIVAHSQGAAIAHAMLQERACERARLLVTFGSGLRKLRQMEDSLAKASGTVWIASLSAVAMVPTAYMLARLVGPLAFVFASGLVVVGFALLSAEFMVMRQRWGYWDGLLRWAAVIFIRVSIYLVAAVFAAAQLLAPPDLVGWGLVVSLIVLLEVVVEIVGTRHRMALMNFEGWEADAGLLPEEFALPDTVSSWVDIFARSDPVPSGSLLPWKPAPNGVYQSHEIENRASFLTDHTSYWSNFEQFVPRLGEALLRLAKYRPPVVVGDEGLERKDKRKATRVRVLRAARLLTSLGWLLTAPIWWSSALAAGRRVIAFAVANVEGSVLAPTSGWNSGVGWLTSDGVVAGCVSVGALLVALAGIDILWGIWDQVANKRAVASAYPRH